MGSGESALADAYELGRRGLDEDCSFMHILELHEKAVTTILQSSSADDEFRQRLTASMLFLVEALSPFEMAFRGYRAFLNASASERH
jgi:phosphoserine phosphatase RsbU-like protein